MEPLPEKMRPQNLTDFVGQEKIIGKDRLLRAAIEKDNLLSMIFWGPSGVGKTTLAKIIAKETDSQFEELSAVTSGIKDLKIIIERAEINNRLRQKTILFIDEIHRWNKKQQDALLPFVEKGTIILIGATTENPSFEINNALLSRSRVFVFEKLEEKEIESIIKKTLKKEFKSLKIKKDALSFLSTFSSGDARVALNVLENAIFLAKDEITLEIVKEALQKQNLNYDKDGEEHHNLISALIKTMRDGDENAALYYLARMLQAGEDPLFIARRIIVFASEDIGLANSLALTFAVSTYEACHYIGMPEARLILAEAVVYMAKNKKSKEIYNAYNLAEQDVLNYGSLSVPMHLRNTSLRFIKKDDYKENLPKKIKNKKYLF